MAKNEINMVGDPSWGPLVVVVDDEVMACDAIQQLLSGMKCRSISFQNGKDAFESLAKIPAVDLFITDMRMPGLDGIGFLNKLREFGVAVPVIVMTGFGDQKAMRSAWSSGAYDFIEKPFTVKLMRERIDLALAFGRQFNLNWRPSFDLNNIFSINLNTTLMENLKARCQERNLDHNRVINQLIASYLGAGK